MGTCHYCMNCGRCRGELPQPFYVRRCVNCGHMNDEGAKHCAQCDTSLCLEPGKTNTIGLPGE